MKSDIEIRNRDLDLFDYLFRHKLATCSQIRRDIYTGISHQAAYKRLNLLLRHRLLKRRTCAYNGPTYVYSLTKKCFRQHVRIKGQKNIQLLSAPQNSRNPIKSERF